MKPAGVETPIGAKGQTAKGARTIRRACEFVQECTRLPIEAQNALEKLVGRVKHAGEEIAIGTEREGHKAQ